MEVASSARYRHHLLARHRPAHHEGDIVYAYDVTSSAASWHREVPRPPPTPTLMGVYDLETGAWKDVVEDVDSLTVAGGRHGAPGPPLPERGARRLRPEVGPGSSPGPGSPTTAAAAGQALGWIGNTLVAPGSTGRIWRYDRRAARGELAGGHPHGQPVSVPIDGRRPPTAARLRRRLLHRRAGRLRPPHRPVAVLAQRLARARA
ncbi:hypothetical protein [Nonomuraea dietziae]|uniref:hypothetical protein n=1 Tax=Nonomuraea dietziae TaxID=65515 RepID=UPI0031D00CE5